MTKLRCAIYTRKSSEEGLDQAFNSLHAQREACEAYVLSQAGEGWTLIKTIYDDGGFSGGNMERPALRSLMRAIDEGLVDVVVVYKVDRLTRSLTDFARIVEQFDAKAVSFVSVTQAFNTTSSMGRLTLNVLLSFAQFEREVTGERIRDKVAASKKKGMWMGGNLPLGYDRPTDLTTRALVLNPAEAETVRLMFGKYLELGSVHDLKRWLDKEGIRSKVWTTIRGDAMGGSSFSRGALFHMLKNRLYLGQIVHKGAAYPGAHPAIVEAETFEAVQASLNAHAHSHNTRTTRVSTMALKGLIFDANADPMSPAFTHGKHGRLHRYYVSSPLQKGQRPAHGDDMIRRVPARGIEELVAAQLQRLGRSSAGSRPLSETVLRVEIHTASVQLILPRKHLTGSGDLQAHLESLTGKLNPGERITTERDDADHLRLTIPTRFQLRGGRTWLTGPSGAALATGAAAPDTVMVEGLRSAHALIAALAKGSVGSPETLLPGVAPTNTYERLLCRVAYLAPDIQAAILDGRQPPALSLEDIARSKFPATWEDQRVLFGFTI